MKRTHRAIASACGEKETGAVSARFIAALALVLGAALAGALAAPPGWWSTRNVLAPEQAVQDPHAAVTVGQIKNLAVQAKAEMDVKYAAVGGAGPVIDALVADWFDPNGAPKPDDNQYAAATVGQLKAVAKPFYDRLIALGYLPSGSYPWDLGADPAENYALVTAGQVKKVFAFEIPVLAPLVMEALYYQQDVEAGGKAPFGISVKLTRGGVPQTDIPLTFDVITGSGILADDPEGPYGSTLEIGSNEMGAARCDFYAPTAPGYYWIRASTPDVDSCWFLMIVGGGSGTFPDHPPGASAVTFAYDTDGDGFSDAVELAVGSDPKLAASVPQRNPAFRLMWDYSFREADTHEWEYEPPWAHSHLQEAWESVDAVWPEEDEVRVWLDQEDGSPPPITDVLGHAALPLAPTHTSYDFDAFFAASASRSERVIFDDSSGDVIWGTYRTAYATQSRVRLRASRALPVGHSETVLQVVETYTMTPDNYIDWNVPPVVTFRPSITFTIPPNQTWSDPVVIDVPPAGPMETVDVSLVRVEIDLRQHDNTLPVEFASLGATPAATAAAPGSSSIGNPTQGDDFVVVSNGSDDDLASELVINVPANSINGTVAANLSMAGSDGSLKFDRNTVAITPGSPEVVKIWGITPSSGENMSKIEIEFVPSNGGPSKLTEDLTIIDGVKISFEGTFYSPVDSRVEGWRPTATDPAAAIAEDGGDFSSTLSFCDGDQPVTYRADSIKPTVTVKKIESIRPAIELKKDPLIGAEVRLVSGHFRHNANDPSHSPPLSQPQHEEIDNPVIEFTKPSTSDSFFKTNLLNNGNTTQISIIGGTSGLPGLANVIQGKAVTGSALAIWLNTVRGVGVVPTFLEGLSKVEAEWKNEKFASFKESLIRTSTAAKAAVGAQELRGSEKTKVKFKLHHYNGWTLNGQVTGGELETP